MAKPPGDVKRTGHGSSGKLPNSRPNSKNCRRTGGNKRAENSKNQRRRRKSIQAGRSLVVRIYLRGPAYPGIGEDQPENDSDSGRTRAAAGTRKDPGRLTCGKAGEPHQFRNGRRAEVSRPLRNQPPGEVGALRHRAIGPRCSRTSPKTRYGATIKTRLAEKTSGRTINMEVGELSRAVGHQWSILWPKVRKLEERKDVGIALSPEQERRLLDAVTAQDSPSRSQALGTFLRVALLIGMRAGEITSLSWGQVDLESRILSVGRAKTASGTGRQIRPGRALDSRGMVHPAIRRSRSISYSPSASLSPTTPRDPLPTYRAPGAPCESEPG